MCHMEKGVSYADVIIDVSIDKLDRPFSYRIPERLSGIIKVGSRVRIPFGAGNKEKKGYVTAIRDTAGYDDEKIKDIMAGASVGKADFFKEIGINNVHNRIKYELGGKLA